MGERLPDVARRVGREELGPYAHFRAGPDGTPTRHTVNVPYLATPETDDPDVHLDDQHSDYRLA